MVTIIIPIHNSEKYLEECVESARSQTFEDIEILCIDGGSVDRSCEIIEELQKRDARIIYVSDPNTSYGHKINVGIAKASGKYISILESDDKMCPEMLAKLYDIAEQYQADIVDANYYSFFCYGGKEYRESMIKYSSLDCYNHLIDCTDCAEKEVATSGIWTALYKREFLKNQNILLNESKGASYQDASFLFLTGILAKTVYHLNIPLYQYRIDNVGSSVKNDKKIFEIIYEMEFLKKALEKRGIQDQVVWKLFYIRKYNAFYWNYCRLSSESREKFLEKYLKELKLDIQNGLVDKKVFTGALYDHTFLIVDNKEKFINMIMDRGIRTWEEKFCDLLDMVGSQKVVVFGAGVYGTKLVKMLQQNEDRVLGICDNSKSIQGTNNNGFIVISVEEAVDQFKNALYIIPSQKYADQMKRQLLERKIKETDIIIFA